MYHERNNLEIKTEFTEYLLSVLVPLIHEGLKAIYSNAEKISYEYDIKARDTPGLENPGKIKLFQILLSEIPNLNTNKIDREVTRIRDNSRCADVFDNLIRSVIKSYIIMLTFNSTEKTCELIDKRYHENIDIKAFIHRCYIEAAKNIHAYPELFDPEIDPNRANIECRNILRQSILNAIRSTLPMREIIDEYLRNDYIKDASHDIEEMRRRLQNGVGHIDFHDGGPDPSDIFTQPDLMHENKHENKHEKHENKHEKSDRQDEYENNNKQPDNDPKPEDLVKHITIQAGGVRGNALLQEAVARVNALRVQQTVPSIKIKSERIDDTGSKPIDKTRSDFINKLLEE